MTTKEAILAGLRSSGRLVAMFTGDLTSEQLHHRPVPDANAGAWIIGHLVLSERSALRLLGATDLPELEDGFEQMFARNETAPAAQDFGDATRLPAMFDTHRQLLLETIEKADESVFDQPLPDSSPIADTIGELLVFFVVHVSTHVGHFSTIRRSLGMPPLI
ncbi:MAG: DinB family protein [Planctomycetota bacterium]